MCPNEACERYGQETGLLGGCDCGAALVPFKTRDEQVSEALDELFYESAKRLRAYLADPRPRP